MLVSSKASTMKKLIHLNTWGKLYQNYVLKLETNFVIRKLNLKALLIFFPYIVTKLIGPIVLIYSRRRLYLNLVKLVPGIQWTTYGSKYCLFNGFCNVSQPFFDPRITSWYNNYSKLLRSNFFGPPMCLISLGD